MYRGGLIFSIFSQIFVALLLFTLASVSGVLFGGDKPPSESGYASGIVGQGLDLVYNWFNSSSNANSLLDGLIALFSLLGIVNVAGMTLGFFALRNLRHAEKLSEKFNRTLAVSAGIFAIFGNIFSAIYILNGITAEIDRIEGKPVDKIPSPVYKKTKPRRRKKRWTIFH